MTYGFADEAKTTVQRLSDGAFIPVGGVHYWQVEEWIKAGNTVAPFVPDPNAVANERKAKIAFAMLAAIADDANAGKTLDQIRAEIKAQITAEPA